MIHSFIKEVLDLIQRVESYESDLINIKSENDFLNKKLTENNSNIIVLNTELAKLKGISPQFKSGDIELTYTRLNGKVETIKIDKNEKLSKNFKVSEFLSPGSNELVLDELLVTILQNIRDHFGKAVTITSGYRTQAYNDSLPCSDKNSLHIKGMAFDIMVSGVNKNVVLAYIKTIPNIKYAYTNETNMKNAVHGNI